MEIMLFFLLGAVFGSFFNVVGLRVPMNRSFLQGRSACPHCNGTLKWLHLIPILSYLLQGRKCPYCKTTIPITYVLTECVTAALFSYSFIMFGYSVELIIALLLISMLMIVFVSDVTYMVIPNKVLLFFLSLFMFIHIFMFPDSFLMAVFGAFIGYSLIALIILLSRGGMGAGDMKLFGVLGFILGWKYVLVTFFIAVFIGGTLSVIYLLRKKIKKNEAIPFGPYIVIGALMTFFKGDLFLDVYLQVFAY